MAMNKDWEGPRGPIGIQKTQNGQDTPGDENPISKQDVISNILEIAGKTIGADLTCEKPKGSTGITLGEEKPKEKPEQELKATESWKRRQERENSKKPYVLTKEEREVVKELLGMDDEFLDIHDIYIYNDGVISVKSPDYTWWSLCGREWNVNLQEKTAKCVALS